MIDQILQREEFQEQPPVLFDIGASGNLPETWKNIARYSICVACDGDARDFDYLENTKKQFRQLITINKIITPSGGVADFYLTRSPYCSSTLKPNTSNLNNYAFAELFQVEQVVNTETQSLSAILKENRIEYIDWFKTDTQGTDLRIVRSLDDPIAKNVIIYELEPGIIDAYEDEDKLFSVLEYFNKMGFIVLDATIKGSHRFNPETANRWLSENLLIHATKFLPQTPDWCEISFFNSFNNTPSKRDLLLAWIFAWTKKQYGLALEIVAKGAEIYNDEIFQKLGFVIAGEFKNHFDSVSNKTFKNKIKQKLISIISKI